MQVTKDVVRDLMPLYEAGEVSADTRRLVEEWMKAHPEERMEGGGLRLPQVGAPADVEMRSLERTRQLYGRRTTVLAAAMAVTYTVFSFRFSGRGVEFVFYRDWPEAAWILLAAGACLWGWFLMLHRQWVRAGLAGGTPFVKGVWMMGGVLAMLPYAFVVSYRFGWSDVRALSVVGAFLGLAVGKALHGGNGGGGLK